MVYVRSGGFLQDVFGWVESSMIYTLTFLMNWVHVVTSSTVTATLGYLSITLLLCTL